MSRFWSGDPLIPIIPRIRTALTYALVGLVLGACGQERAPAPPFHPVPLGDPWYESAPLVSVWTLPEEDMNRFGLDVNGVWTWWSGSDLTSLHEQGHRAMISMEVINMDRAEYPKLIPGLSKDICGSESEVSWLQDKVTMSIQSPLIQKFLLDSTARAIRVGVDAIFIDEIQTSAVEISLDRFGAGFGPDELNAFNQNLTTLGYPSFADYVAQIRGSTFTSTELQDLFALADPAGVTPTVFFKACSNTCGKSVSQASACTPAFYSLRKQVFKAYKAFQEDSGFAIMTDLVAQMRAMIRDSGKAVAIGANLVGLGAQTGWSPMAAPFWTKDLDFLVCEHGVNAFPDGWDTFLLPPAGSFAPLYKLGRALVPGFVSAFPGGALAEYWQSLPRTQTLIELMFSEAFAAEGNWSISYWNEEKGWPTDFLAPAGLAQYTRFVAENRGFYTGPRDRNPVAIVYTNQGVLADPDRNESYVGLAQALDRLHVQYDVLYGGDDRFWAAPIDESLLAKYHVVFLPNANALTTEQIGVFTRRATSGAATIALAPIDPGLSAAGLTALTDLGQQYRRGDLDGASAALDAALSNAGAERVVRTVSAPDLLVSAQFRTDGPRFVVHFVNEAYNSNQDSVPDRTNIDVVVRRPAAVDSTWKLSLCAPGGAPRTLGYQLEGDEIRIRIPNLHIYGVLVFTPPT